MGASSVSMRRGSNFDLARGRSGERRKSFENNPRTAELRCIFATYSGRFPLNLTGIMGKPMEPVASGGTCIQSRRRLSRRRRTPARSRRDRTVPPRREPVGLPINPAHSRPPKRGLDDATEEAPLGIHARGIGGPARDHRGPRGVWGAQAHQLGGAIQGVGGVRLPLGPARGAGAISDEGKCLCHGCEATGREPADAEILRRRRHHDHRRKPHPRLDLHPDPHRPRFVQAGLQRHLHAGRVRRDQQHHQRHARDQAGELRRGGRRSIDHGPAFVAATDAPG